MDDIYFLILKDFFEIKCDKDVSPKYFEIKILIKDISNYIQDLIKLYQKNNIIIYCKITKIEQLLVILIENRHLIIRKKQDKCSLGFIIKDEIEYLYEKSPINILENLKYLLS
jgi:hypothetical protein